MAKLGLLFVAIFCIVQISLAARLPRETVVETSTINVFDSLGASLSNAFGKAQDEIQKTFTKENANKFIASVQDASNDFQKKAGDLLSDASSKISEFSEKAKKEFETTNKD